MGPGRPSAILEVEREQGRGTPWEEFPRTTLCERTSFQGEPASRPLQGEFLRSSIHSKRPKAWRLPALPWALY